MNLPAIVATAFAPRAHAAKWRSLSIGPFLRWNSILGETVATLRRRLTKTPCEPSAVDAWAQQYRFGSRRKNIHARTMYTSRAPTAETELRGAQRRTSKLPLRVKLLRKKIPPPPQETYIIHILDRFKTDLKPTLDRSMLARWPGMPLATGLI